jgi:uncharacterized protein (TIGR02391 family)
MSKRRDNGLQKLVAYCTECGFSQGIFNDEAELRFKIAKTQKCENCGATFGFLRDGRIWHLHWDTIPYDKPLELDFWSMIHEDIIKVAKDKFEDEYYADAVESALKEVNSRVKEIVKSKTGEELDGARLMNKAFSENNPIIVLNNLSDENGRNIQIGYMQIFAGAMTGIRNPKAHANITIGRERAIHFIFLASLLMYKLDEALRP